MIKKVQLEILERDIKNAIPAFWLFEEQNGVKGFWGTGGEKKIMFVAERPSSKK